MKHIPMRALMAVLTCVLVQTSLMSAQAATLKAARPDSTSNAFKSAGGSTSKAKPGTYCCTTNGQCTPHDKFAVCAGPDYIRWECKPDGSCSRVPFGGDN